MLERTVSAERLPCYTIGYFFGFWPGLVHEYRRIANQPDELRKQELAMDFRDRVAMMGVKVMDIGEPMIEKALLARRLLELPDPENPIGEKFHFKSMDLLSAVMAYGMMRTILNRLQYQATELLGDPDTLLEIEHHNICKLTWMCIPFIRGLGMIPCMMFTSMVFLSYEGAYEVEREYLLDAMMELASYNRRYPQDKVAVEHIILHTAKAWTGRTTFAPSIQAAATGNDQERGG